MPAYSWLYDDDLDISHTEGKIITMQKLGVPYPYDYEFDATSDLEAQQKAIAAELESQGIKNVDPKKEIVALIAYLQRMGTDIKRMPGSAPKEFPGESTQLIKTEYGR